MEGVFVKGRHSNRRCAIVWRLITHPNIEFYSFYFNIRIKCCKIVNRLLLGPTEISEIFRETRKLINPLLFLPANCFSSFSRHGSLTQLTMVNALWLFSLLLLAIDSENIEASLARYIQ